MSQPDVITLSVDEENDGVDPVDHVYGSYDRSASNRSVYTEASHLPYMRDILTFYRTPAKPNGNFRGVQKSAFKTTKDFVVTGVDGVAQLTAPVIIEVSFSIPVGVSAADVLVERQKTVALADYDVVMNALNNQLSI